MSARPSSSSGRRLAVRLVVYAAVAIVPTGVLVGLLAREVADGRRLEALAQARAAPAPAAAAAGGVPADPSCHGPRA
jgi:hypothetical protein